MSLVIINPMIGLNGEKVENSIFFPGLDEAKSANNKNKI